MVSMDILHTAQGASEQHASLEQQAPLIEMRNLTKYFKGFPLDALTFTVEASQVVGLIGQNGAGKSTTIKTLLGLTRADGGEARVLGTTCNDLSFTETGAAIKERIGVVLDATAIPGNIPLSEVATLMQYAYATFDREAYDSYLHLFKLTDTTKRVKNLSRGMGMKLQLACALAHHPQLLILDEATAGLDPLARDETLEVLRAFANTEDEHHNPVNAILMSSHITDDLDKIADKVVCIDKGYKAFEVNEDEVCDHTGCVRCRKGDVAAVLCT